MSDAKTKALQLLHELQDRQESLSESEVDEIIGSLIELSPDPYISDYIFHSTPALSPEEIVEKAFNYRPIQL